MFAYRKMAALRLRYLDECAGDDVSGSRVASARSDAVGGITGALRVSGGCDGSGASSVDLLRSAGLDCRVVAAMITAGEAESTRNNFHYVPKRDLIVGLQVLLQRGGLQIARGMRLEGF